MSPKRILNVILSYLPKYTDVLLLLLLLLYRTELCEAIASMTKRLCTEYVDPRGLEAILANRLYIYRYIDIYTPIGRTAPSPLSRVGLGYRM